MDTSSHRLPLPAAELRLLRAAARLGQVGEEVAARHLEQADGLRLLARNWRVAQDELRGELDLVAVEIPTGTLVVCEVKVRRDADRFGGAANAVDAAKLRRLRALTGAFLREQATPVPAVRLDLVAIDVAGRGSLTHLVGLG